MLYAVPEHITILIHDKLESGCISMLLNNINLLDSCDERCGWAVVLCGAIAKGSFGVPIKGRACSKVDVDPLVMQTYKTVLCLMFSFILLFIGVPLHFTPWGIASGLFWVPGGTAGAYAIRTNGLASSFGLWSSIIVMNSFIVGIFIFHERVKSIYGASSAALLILFGIGGMTRYSHPLRQPRITTDNSDLLILKVPPSISHQEEGVAPDSSNTMHQVQTLLDPNPLLRSRSSVPSWNETHIQHFEIEAAKDRILIAGYSFTRNQLGFACAIFTGLWGGSNLIPMHFARRSGIFGLGYIFSFASGSMLVLIIMWLIRYFIYVCQTGSLSDAYYALPSFHIKQLLLPGFLSGSLYSIGNICSILSVSYLGQGVGFSVIQSSLLISGLWGIFFYKEIRGIEMIVKWFCAAILTLIGIVWLTYEHESGASGSHRL